MLKRKTFCIFVCFTYILSEILIKLQKEALKKDLFSFCSFLELNTISYFSVFHGLIEFWWFIWTYKFEFPIRLFHLACQIAYFTSVSIRLFAPTPWHSMERGLCVIPSLCVCHMITRDNNITTVKVLFPLNISEHGYCSVWDL